jgi:hypothetical protein
VVKKESSTWGQSVHGLRPAKQRNSRRHHQSCQSCNPVKQLSQYDLHGDLLFSALDVNQNGVIDPEPVEGDGPDCVTGHTAAYIIKDNALWQESTQSVYPDFSSNRAVTTAKSRRKLTNLGAFASVAEAEDIRGNVTTSTQTVDPGTGYAIATTTIPTSVQPQIQTQRYGLLAGLRGQP